MKTAGISQLARILSLLLFFNLFAFTAYAVTEVRLNYSLTLQVTTTDGYSAAGSLLYMEGLEPPSDTIEDIIPDGGVLVIENISCGNYLLKIMKPGYEIYRDTSLYICSDDTLDIVLQEGRWPVWNFSVDPLTSLATWCEPLDGVLLNENFENEMFPPSGWSNEHLSPYGWFRTDHIIEAANWEVPDHDGFFACSNDDYAGGSDSWNSCCDYLITPPMDLSAYEDYMLVYDTYFDGLYGGSASVEYSEDGQNWNELYMLEEVDDLWREEVVDLSQWSGLASTESFLLRFHFNDNGQWADGWAVDNVKVAPASSDIFRNEDELTAYNLYLDGMYVGSTTDTLYIYRGLVYDQVFEAAVEAIYSSGPSAKEYYLFKSEYLVPATNLQVETMDDTALLTWDIPQDSTQIIIHLKGYNIYRDNFGEEADSVFFIDDPEQTYWYDTNLAPKIYSYGVTAVYDISMFGYPGQTDESAMAGPVDCMISYGYDLPFLEDWDSGSFSLQQWESECNEWQINMAAGNDAPSAVFKVYDSLTAYECSLTSFPIKGSLYPGGGIYIEFDVKLEDISADSLEKLQLRVWRNGFWSTVWEQANQGSFDWKPQQVSLSDYACGKDFKIAFVATGEDASNIDAWLIDNVHIYHICPAPYDLSAENTGEEIFLTWNSADTVPVFTEWLQWCSDSNSTGVGYGGPADFDVAARFEPADLQSVNGMYVKEVHFYPLEENCEYYVRVWTGSEAANLVVDEKVQDVVIGEWNRVTLSSPALINASEELWIGYRCIAGEGNPAGVDEGPAIAGFGDMLFDDGEWISIYQEIGLNYNWNIKGFVSAEAEGLASTPLGKTASSPRKSVSESRSKTGFTGYNIYRKHDNNSWERLNDDPLLVNEYLDPVSSGGDYCYYVEAIYEGCTSVTSDTICVSSWLGTTETGTADLQVWPNPAKDFIRITSSEPMERISVYNMQGRKVLERKMAGKKICEIETDYLSPGVYLLKIQTAVGHRIYRFIVSGS